MPEILNPDNFLTWCDRRQVAKMLIGNYRKVVSYNQEWTNFVENWSCNNQLNFSALLSSLDISPFDHRVNVVWFLQICKLDNNKALYGEIPLKLNYQLLWPLPLYMFACHSTINSWKSGTHIMWGWNIVMPGCIMAKTGIKLRVGWLKQQGNDIYM